MAAAVSGSEAVLVGRSVPASGNRLHSERRLSACQIAACAMLFLLLLYFFDFVEVFIPPSTTLNRVFVFSAIATGLAILVSKLPLSLRVLQVAWPSLMVVAWFGVTTLWAAYPEISKTRALSFGTSYLAALGLAVGLRSPRALTTVFFAAFSIIIAADLISLAFESSYTEIGVQGMHKHKNAAGFAASVAVTALAFALPQLRSPAVRVPAVALILAGVLFLLLTKSKTCIGLLIIALCLVPLYRFWVRRHTARPFDFIMTAVACTMIFVAGASGTKLSKVGEVAFGDPTLTNRMALWVAVEDMIAQSPRRGHGFGSIWDLGNEWNSFPHNGYVFYNDPEIINEAHNGYLDLVLHGGHLALVLAWFVTLRALWFSFVFATSDAVPRRQRWAFCMIHCLVVLLLVHNLMESTLFFPGSHSSYFFLILLAQVERWRAEFHAVRQTYRPVEGLATVAVRRG
jgi:O-antigen ligase